MPTSCGSPVLGQALEAPDHVVGVDGAFDAGGQSLPRALVDDVQELEHPFVVGLVKLEVAGPHDVGPDRSEGTDRAPDPPERLLALPVGHTRPSEIQRRWIRLWLARQLAFLASTAARRYPPAGAGGEVPEPRP